MRKINNHETSYNRLSNSNRLIEQDKIVSLYHSIAKRFYNYYFAYLAANKTQKKKKEYRNNISISRPENVQSCRSRLTRLQAGL